MTDPNRRDPIRFGPFQANPLTGELLRNGASLRVQPQPFRVLMLLLSRPGELVSREEVRAALWNEGTTVEFDQGLNYCIRQIRVALDDDAANPTYIETLPKRGYRFIGAVTPEVPAAPPAGPHQQELVTRERGKWWIAAVAAGASAIAVLGWSSGRFRQTEAPKSILVRPCVTLGLAENDVWLGDALAQQLVGGLAETKALRVVPWSSSLALKGEHVTSQQLARRFGVDAVLECSVSEAGQRVQVMAQLVNGPSERTMWSYRDALEASDIGTAQDNMLSAIASALKVRIAAGGEPGARRLPQDLETRNLYVKAMYMSNLPSTEAARASIDDFREVIRREPGYASAYAGLANGLTMMILKPDGGNVRDLLARARDAAQQAIALDPSLAAAHAALAHSLFHDWKWKAAQEEFEIALRLDGDSAITHQLYSIFLATQGKSKSAIGHARRAVDLAPTDALINYSFETVLFHCGHYDEAVKQSRQLLQLDPHNMGAYLMQARAYTSQGMFAEAAEAIRTLQELEMQGHSNNGGLWLAYALAKSGRVTEARLGAESWLRSRSRKGPGHAALLLALGEKDRAIEALEQSAKQHMPSMVWVKSTPELAPLADDPRFVALLARMDLNRQ